MLFNVIFKKFTKLKSYIHICAKKQVLSSDKVPHSIFFPLIMLFLLLLQPGSSEPSFIRLFSFLLLGFLILWALYCMLPCIFAEIRK